MRMRIPVWVTGVGVTIGVLTGWPGAAAAAQATQVAVVVPQAEESNNDEGEHRNDLALIIAGTYEDEAGHFTTGLEFEHRFISLVGAGAAFEYVTERASWVFVFPVSFHPIGGLKLLAAPGFEHEDGGNEFIIRIGGAYELEFAERFSVSPSLEMDFIGREHALVYGLDFGMSF